MSQQVTFEVFCQHYDLDEDEPNSLTEYEAYCQNMAVMNNAFADKFAKEAITKTAQDSKKPKQWILSLPALNHPQA